MPVKTISYPITVSKQSGNGFYPLALRSYQLGPGPSRILGDLVDFDIKVVGRTAWEIGGIKVELDPEFGVVRIDDTYPRSSMFDIPYLARSIAEHVLLREMRRVGLNPWYDEEGSGVPFWWRSWKLSVFRKIISKQLAGILPTWIGMTDDNIIKIQKRLFSIFGRWPPKPTIAAALNMRYQDDMFRFRAAAYACWSFQFEAKADGWDWIERYSPAGKIGRRALYVVPGGITEEHIGDVVRLPLTKVPTSRKRWLLLARASQLYRYLPPQERVDAIINIVERSSDSQVAKAYRILADHYGYPPAGRKINSVMYAWGNMLDAPVPQSKQATVVRYAESSIEYHRDLIAEHVEFMAERYGDLEFPGLPSGESLPPGFTHLNSVDLLKAESRHMNNCVLNYAPTAASGYCYLFDYEGVVTLEVVDGKVVQALGHSNRMTSVSEDARKKLDRWCRAIKWPEISQEDRTYWDGDIPF